MTGGEGCVYLSAADRQLEGYLDEAAFERSLLLNILFQPRVLIPDIFFFISTGVAKHLGRPHLTLLEAGLQTGDIVPSFRDPSITTFGRALKVVKGEGDRNRAILGIRHDAEATAKRLDEAIERAAAFRPAYWPQTSVAEGYERLAVRLLMVDDPPGLPSECGIPPERMLEIWNATTKWRTQCLVKAIEETKHVAGSGLRRGALMSAVGRSLGVVADTGEINDVAELVEAETISPEDRFALHYFCRWITDIYHYNQSRALGATPNFPGYEPLEGAMATQLLREATSGVKASQRPSDRSSIRIEVAMPQPRWLSELPAHDLLAIKHDVGAGYVNAVKEWQRISTSATEQELQVRLTEYGVNLADRVRRAAGDSDGFLQAVFSRFALIDPVLVAALGAVAGLTVSELFPDKAVFLTVGSTGYALCRWYQRQPVSVVVDVGIPRAYTRHQKSSDINIIQPITESAEEKSA